MEIKKICDSIIELYHLEDLKTTKEEVLALHLVNQLRQEIEFEKNKQEGLALIFNLIINISSSKKRLKQILEKELLALIAYLPHNLWANKALKDVDRTRLNKESNDVQLAEMIIIFATEIYEIKLDRDAFGGKRRGFSLQILESLSNFFEVPELLDLCMRSAESKSKIEFVESIECLKSYYLRTSETPSQQLMEIIERRIQKAKNRVEIISCLDFKIEIGLIDGYEANEILSEWGRKR